MVVNCKYDSLELISKLKPSLKNENRHTKEQIERLAKILDFQGFRKPIIVSKRSGFMVTGHATLEAAKLNKYEAVPVSFQNFESEDQENAHRVCDNSISTWSQLDFSAINLMIPEFDGGSFDLEVLGLKDFKIDRFEKEESKASKPKEKHCPECGHVF